MAKRNNKEELDIWNSMTAKQKDLVYLIVGQAIEDTMKKCSTSNYIEFLLNNKKLEEDTDG